MIRPTGFEVGTGTGIALDICFEDETLIDEDPFFKIEQDGESIVVTLECLRGLVEAAEQLMAGRRTHD